MKLVGEGSVINGAYPVTWQRHKPGEEESVTKVFVQQPLASPESAKNCLKKNFNTFDFSDFDSFQQF